MGVPGRSHGVQWKSHWRYEEDLVGSQEGPIGALEGAVLVAIRRSHCRVLEVLHIRKRF